MIQLFEGKPERIAIEYVGTLTGTVAPALYVDDVLNAITVSVDTSVAGKIVLTHVSTGLAAWSVLTYIGGTMTISGQTYPMVVAPRVVIPIVAKVDVDTIKTQAVTAAAPVTFPATIGNSTYAGADTQGTMTLLGRTTDLATGAGQTSILNSILAIPARILAAVIGG